MTNKDASGRSSRLIEVTAFLVAAGLFVALLDPFEIVYPERFRKSAEDDISSSSYKTNWPAAEGLINVHLVPHTQCVPSCRKEEGLTTKCSRTDVVRIEVTTLDGR